MPVLGVRASGGPAGGVGGVRGYWGLHRIYQDGLLQNTLENSRQPIVDNRTWAECNWTKVSTILGHQIALPVGGTSDLGMSDFKCQGDLMSDCKCEADLM